MLIAIHAYDSEWPVRYDRMAANIRQTLGSLALRVDHIGSTAVPGLAAKDIVDIQISVTSFDPESDYRVLSERIGFVFRPDDDPEHRFFKLDSPVGRRLVNVHVCEAGSKWEARHLAFRDYLRANPRAAADYERLTFRLSSEHEDLLSYTNAKTEFILQAIGE